MRSVYFLPLLLLVLIPFAYADSHNVPLTELQTLPSSASIDISEFTTIGDSVYHITYDHYKTSEPGTFSIVWDDREYIAQDMSSQADMQSGFAEVTTTEYGTKMKITTDGVIVQNISVSFQRLIADVDDDTNDQPEPTDDNSTIEDLEKRISELEAENKTLRDRIDELTDEILDMTQAFIDNIIMIENLFKDELEKMKNQE